MKSKLMLLGNCAKGRRMVGSEGLRRRIRWERLLSWMLQVADVRLVLSISVGFEQSVYQGVMLFGYREIREYLPVATKRHKGRREQPRRV